MSIDDFITALIYLVAVFFLFFIGKLVYDKLNRRFVLQEELLQKDNLAVAVAVVGYYLGLVFALGGILIGPASFFWLTDVIDILLYGLASIILLNLSSFINDKIILYKFDNVKEIVDDRNVGTGVIEAANHIAVGLVIYGAISGEGDLITASSFWLLGQVTLIVASLIYNYITPFDVHDEIEKDNVAVGVAFAGMLVAIGNVIRIGLTGDFVSWSINLTQFGSFVLFGFLLMPVLRWVTDKVLLPGESLTKELVQQENPNVGAGVAEAFSYVAASFLLGWVV